MNNKIIDLGDMFNNVAYVNYCIQLENNEFIEGIVVEDKNEIFRKYKNIKYITECIQIPFKKDIIEFSLTRNLDKYDQLYNFNITRFINYLTSEENTERILIKYKGNLPEINFFGLVDFFNFRGGDRIQLNFNMWKEPITFISRDVEWFNYKYDGYCIINGITDELIGLVSENRDINKDSYLIDTITESYIIKAITYSELVECCSINGYNIVYISYINNDRCSNRFLISFDNDKEEDCQINISLSKNPIIIYSKISYITFIQDFEYEYNEESNTYNFIINDIDLPEYLEFKSGFGEKIIIRNKKEIGLKIIK